MSAMNDGEKSKFFGFLKGLWGKSNADEAPPVQTVVSQPVVARPSTTTGPAKPAHGNGNGGSVHRREIASVQVSLHAIISGLSLELRARVKQPEVGDLTVSVAMDKVLGQLSQGAVRIPFG